MIIGQLFRFVIVGVLNTAIGYAIIFGCMYLLGIGPVPSNVAGYLGGLAISFTLNKAFTFKSKAGAGAELGRFVAAFVVAYLANLAVLLACLHLGLHEAWSQVVAGVVYIGVTFLLNKFFVFRLPPDGPRAAVR
ncbi:GtrA family protein [Arenimonas metalli]|uniref:Translocase n=1 Tax=Arenimonas metalli CF5-1 TaxID=1384056 RepID=A0A091AR87_9GAMM|nr:GtrA family protein [Arenimonas metalli]KFN41876.1 translocase [Arenimonas metalli CF5-1]